MCIYLKICKKIKHDNWTVVQSPMGPYAYKDNQWVGFDDLEIAKKKGKYAAENNLGGILFFAVDFDDFRGNCYGKPYPLIEAAKEALLEAYRLLLLVCNC